MTVAWNRTWAGKQESMFALQRSARPSGGITDTVPNQEPFQYRPTYRRIRGTDEEPSQPPWREKRPDHGLFHCPLSRCFANGAAEKTV